MTFTGLEYMSNTTGVLLEAGFAYPSRVPGFNPGIFKDDHIVII
jgi:hypothetical protein